jgi:hypothetical protein
MNETMKFAARRCSKCGESMELDSIQAVDKKTIAVFHCRRCDRLDATPPGPLQHYKPVQYIAGTV